MFKRIFKDVLQFVGLLTLLAVGTFGLYIAIVAYQLCQIDNLCPLRFQKPQTTSLLHQPRKHPSKP
jgi:hypothetical protein